MDRRYGQELVRHRNLAFDIVLLDELRECLAVDCKGKEEISDVLVLVNHSFKSGKVRLDGFIPVIKEKLVCESCRNGLKGDVIAKLCFTCDILLYVFKDTAFPGIIEAFRHITTLHSVNLEHERTVDCINAIDIVAVNDAEKMIEELDMFLYKLLPAEYLVWDSCLSQIVDEATQISEVLAQYCSVVEIINLLDNPKNGQ